VLLKFGCDAEQINLKFWHLGVKSVEGPFTLAISECDFEIIICVCDVLLLKTAILESSVMLSILKTHQTA